METKLNKNQTGFIAGKNILFTPVDSGIDQNTLGCFSFNNTTENRGKENGIRFKDINTPDNYVFSDDQTKFSYTKSLKLTNVSSTVFIQTSFAWRPSVYTVDLWIYISSLFYDTVFFKTGTSMFDGCFSIQAKSSNNHIFVNCSGTEVDTGVTLTTGWHHIEVSTNTTNQFAFIDGSLVASKTFVNPIQYTQLDYYTCSVFATNLTGPIYVQELRVSDVVRHTSDFPVPTKKYIEPNGETAIDLGLDVSTTLSSASTHSQIPTARCMYDIVGDIGSALQAIRGVQE